MLRKILIAVALLFSFTSTAQVILQDSLALVDLYFSTTGARWTNNSDWLLTPVENWHGITVNGNRVSRISLSSNNLRGTIPPSIGDLDELERLYLANNNISGNIPAEIAIRTLTVLQLNNNYLSGDVPATFSALTNLITPLSLNDNALTAFPDFTPLPVFVNVGRNWLSWSEIIFNISNFDTYENQFHTYNLNVNNPTPGSGQSVNITVLSDHPNNTFQWYKDGEVLSNENSATLIINSITEFDKGEYYCKIGNTLDPRNYLLKSESFILDPMVSNRKYANSVVSFSSERATVWGGSKQALGAPNTFPSDNQSITFGTENPLSGRGWTGEFKNKKDQIRLSFIDPEPINTIWVYAAGFTAIDSIELMNAASGQFETTINGNVGQIDFPTTNYNVSEVKIYLNNTFNDINEGMLDAVAIGSNDSEISTPYLRATAISDQIVVLDWDPQYNGIEPNEQNGMRYTIERSNISNGSFEIIDTVSFEGLEIFSTRYHDQSAPPNDSLYYRVKAFRDDGRISQYSNIAIVKKCKSIDFNDSAEYSGSSSEVVTLFGGSGTNPLVNIIKDPFDSTILRISDLSADYFSSLGFPDIVVPAILSYDCGELVLEDTGIIPVSCGSQVPSIFEHISAEYFPLNDSLSVVFRWETCNVTLHTGFKLNPTSTIQNPVSNIELLNQGTAVEISWNEENNYETGYQIERSPNTPNNFTEIASTGKNASQYSDESINDGTTYYYRIITLSTSGNSISDTVSISISNSDLLFTKLAGGDFSTDQPANTYSGHFADYDNDGDPDLYLGNFYLGPGNNSDPNLANFNNYFYENDGNGIFTKVTGIEITDDEYGTRGTAWGDINNDGLFDLVVSSGGSGSGFPAHQDPFLNSIIYQNNGDGTFSKISELLSNDGNPLLADFNNDGNLDIITKASTGFDAGLVLWENDNLIFSRKHDFILSDSSFTTIWNILAPDINKDGISDLFITGNFGARLFLGEGSFNFNPEAILINNNFQRGGAFSDFDLDGDIDIMLGGTVPEFYINNGDNTFKARTALEVLGASSQVARSFTFFDFDNDGDEDLICYINSIPTIFSSNGDGTFNRLSSSNLPFNEISSFESVSVADINSDGFQDVFFSATNSSEFEFTTHPSIFLNRPNGNNWVKIKLKGTDSNLNGLGATVSLKTNAGWQVRNVVHQNGLLNGNEMTTHFGVQDFNRIDSIVVVWPSGGISRLSNQTSNQVIIIDEANAQIDGGLEFRFDGILQKFGSDVTFSRVNLGRFEEKDLQITNRRDEEFLIGDIQITNDFSVSGFLPISIEPDSSSIIKIRFSPSVIGNRDGVIEIKNPSNVTVFTLNLFGQGKAVIEPFNVVTPFQDGKHDFLKILNIEFFPDNKVTIYNRWGDEVFSVNSYDNQDRAFYGLDNDGRELPDGNYFYVIDPNDGSDPENGFLYLRR